MIISSIQKSVKIVMLFISLLSSITVGGELKSKVDDFTNVKTSYTDWVELVGKYTTIRFSYKKIENQYLLDVKVVASGRKYWAISKGDEFLLKLGDGSIVSVAAIDDYISCHGCGATGLRSSGVLGIYARYLINEKQIKELISSPPVKFRIKTREGAFDDIIRSSKVFKLVDISKLILTSE